MKPQNYLGVGSTSLQIVKELPTSFGKKKERLLYKRRSESLLKESRVIRNYQTQSFLTPMSSRQARGTVALRTEGVKDEYAILMQFFFSTGKSTSVPHAGGDPIDRQCQRPLNGSTSVRSLALASLG